MIIIIKAFIYLVILLYSSFSYAGELPRQSNAQLDWHDVSAMGDYQKGHQAKRNRAISQQLDQFERSSKSASPHIQTQYKVEAYKAKNPVVPTQIEPYQYRKLEFKKAIETPKQDSHKDIIDVKFGITGGYRVDELMWNKASDISGNVTPNILSELTWSNVHIYQVEGKANVVLLDQFVVEGSVARGEVQSGDNQDSDYAGQNRTIEFSRSNNKSDRGHTEDYSFGGGYRFYIDSQVHDLISDDIWVTFLGGYSHHEQEFHMTELFQTIPASGHFPGLASTYNTQWDSVWAGLELSGEMEKFSGFARFEYHWADYYGYGNWNLRTDLAHPKSFEHFTQGQGIVWKLGGAYELVENWNIDFQADIQNWKGTAGREIFHSLILGDVPLKFNEVNWDSYAFKLGASYSFN